MRVVVRVVGHEVLPGNVDLAVERSWVPRWDVSARLLVWCGRGSLEKVPRGA